MLHWVVPCQIIQVMSPLPHGFFRRVYDIFKKLRIDDDKGNRQIQQFLR